MCGLIALYAVIRIILEQDVMRKLPFLNVFSFAVSGIMALLIPHPLGIIAAATYFIGSTFESNAIASTWAGGWRNEHPAPDILCHCPYWWIVCRFCTGSLCKTYRNRDYCRRRNALIIARGYVDVAAALALIIPLSTILYFSSAKGAA